MIIDLVDSIEYTTTNSFTHQLHKCLHEIGGIVTVPLEKIKNFPNPSAVICRLKQRTLHRVLPVLEEWLKGCPIVIFDQDPWHAFMIDSPYIGVYERANDQLNVKAFAVTTNWWAKFLNENRLPGMFVRMGLLPEYCSELPSSKERKIELGFVGQLHPYRKKLFDELSNCKLDVTHIKNVGYSQFLRKLSDIEIFIHAEECEVSLEDRKIDLNVGLWVKDIEAIGRGCFSIRNRGEDSESYDLDNHKTMFLYDDVKEVPEIIETIKKIDEDEKRAIINSSVARIKESNNWLKTARKLQEALV